MIAGGRIITRPVRFEATPTMFYASRNFESGPTMWLER
jgi:hypothetical protein